MSAALELRGVGLREAGRAVLEGVSLVLEAGSVWGLYGPNGAGKSALLRVAATLAEPTEGSVFVDGVDAREAPAAARRRLGYLGPSQGLYGRGAVRAHLEFFAQAAGVDAEVVDGVLELLDLEGLAEREAQGLAPAELQRVGLARALLHDPLVLLLDEPWRPLDAGARGELDALLRELGELGKAVLVSASEPKLLAESCTHVAVLRGGELRAAVPAGALARAEGGRQKLRVRTLTEPEDLPVALAGLDVRIDARASAGGTEALLELPEGERAAAQAVARIALAGIPLVRVEPVEAQSFELALRALGEKERAE